MGKTMTDQNGSDSGWTARLLVPAGAESDRGGFLTVEVGPQRSTVPISAAHTQLVLTLHEAARRDAEMGCDAPAQGWRSPRQLAKSLVQRAPDRIEVEEQTIRSYASRIQRGIREAILNERIQGECPSLFEHRKQVGLRLPPGKLVVVDRDA